MQARRNGRSALARSLSLTSGCSAIRLRRLASSQASQSTAPIMPKAIARGGQEDRDGAGLHQRALMQRLVVVAVEKDEVAAPCSTAFVTTLLEVLVPFRTK